MKREVVAIVKAKQTVNKLSGFIKDNKPEFIKGETYELIREENDRGGYGVYVVDERRRKEFFYDNEHLTRTFEIVEERLKSEPSVEESDSNGANQPIVSTEEDRNETDEETKFMGTGEKRVIPKITAGTINKGMVVEDSGKGKVDLGIATVVDLKINITTNSTQTAVAIVQRLAERLAPGNISEVSVTIHHS